MKKSFPFVLLAAALFAAPVAAHAATLVINTPKVELELPPGGTYSGEITVENPTDTEASLKVYLEDWMYTTVDGEKKFAPSGSMPLSAASWITFAPPPPSIPPFGRTVLRYTVRVPDPTVPVTGGHYSVLFFETVIGNMPNEEGVSVDVAGRIGTLFLIDVKGATDRKGEITSLEVAAPVGNRPMEIHTSFKNTGNVAISLEGSFLILDAAGQVKARGELAKMYTFPGQAVEGKSEWIGRLPKGTYNVIVTYNLGKGKSLVEERALTIA